MEKERHIDSIDFLKGLAFLFVFAVHAAQFVDGIPQIIRKPMLFGQIGSQLFLFCTGALLYRGTILRADTFCWLRFMKGKYCRMLPAYVAAMLLYVLLNAIFDLVNVATPFPTNDHVLAYVLNGLLAHGLFPFCLNNVVPGGWYVGTLMLVFALVTPLLIMLGDLPK